ncbi:MAG: ester cyclase [Chloroflexota bacterium]
MNRTMAHYTMEISHNTASEVNYRKLIEPLYYEVYGAGKYNILDEILHPDFANRLPASEEMLGREAFKNAAIWYRKTFIDSQWEIHDFLVAGDKIVVRYSATARYQGGWLNLPPREEPIYETGIAIYRIEDDKVREMWCEMSDVQIAHQLGAFDSPMHQSSCPSCPSWLTIGGIHANQLPSGPIPRQRLPQWWRCAR